MSAPPAPPADTFEAALAAFLRRLARAPVGEAAVRVGLLLAVDYASRATFEATGQLSAWPAMKTVASGTGLFLGRVRDAIGRLEAAGLVTVTRPETRGAGHHFVYTMHPEKVLADPNLKVLASVTFPGSEKVLASPNLSGGEKVLSGPNLKVRAGQNGKFGRAGTEVSRNHGWGAATAHQAPVAAPTGDTSGGHSGARDRACLSPASEADYEGRDPFLEPAHAPDHDHLSPDAAFEDLHLDHARGCPVTAADLDHLDRLGRLDRLGQADDPGDDPRQVAARALAALHPDRHLDFALLVDDLADGADGDDALLEERCAVLGALAARGPAGRLERGLAGQRAALRGLFAATAPERAAALTARCMELIATAAAAARAEAEAEAAQRRGAAHVA